MNILMQVCGIVNLIVLIIFYLAQKKLYLKTEKSFLGMLFITLLTHGLDILSLYAIKERDTLPSSVVEILCKLYLVSLIVIVMAVYSYISQDVFRKKSEYYRGTLLYNVFTIIGIEGVMFLPISIFDDGKWVHTYGPATTATYITVLYGFVNITFRAVAYRKRINRDRLVAVLIWMGLWSMAASLQFVFKGLLVVSFAASVGMMILYIKLEDPGMNINKESGLYNQNALLEYIKQKCDRGKNFALVLFRLDNTMNQMQGLKFNWAQAGSLLRCKEAITFRSSEDEGILIFQEASQAEAWLDKILEVIHNASDNNARCLRKALWVRLDSTSIFENTDELLDFLRFVEVSQYLDADRKRSKRIVVDETVLAEMHREKEIERLIEEALKEDRVEVFYQPIYSIKEDKFTTAEALVRIRDEEKNLVPPGLFIPIAEKNGKILTLGNSILEKVCRFIREREPQKLGMDYIEVNLSVVQCADEKLASSFIAMLNEYEIAPDRINFEITESAELKRRDIFKANLEALQEYGISFSLDDFGTGHSNLNYIVEMPVEIVKFDRDMTNAFFVEEKARVIMETAINMIHDMGLKVVVEGIETREQFEKMKELGVDYIQGFFFSRPVPQDEFYDFIKKNNFS